MAVAVQVHWRLRKVCNGHAASRLSFLAGGRGPQEDTRGLRVCFQKQPVATVEIGAGPEEQSCSSCGGHIDSSQGDPHVFSTSYANAARTRPVSARWPALVHSRCTKAHDCMCFLELN